jgi:hypothetical protein
VIVDYTPICEGYTIKTPPPTEIVCSGNIFIVYLAVWPAPVVLAEKVALVRVCGVLVMIVTGRLPGPTLSRERMLRFGSVMFTSKRPLGLVVGGF